jgi:hypothetical protein
VGVEVTHIQPTKKLHQAGDRIVMLGCYQQVYVVGHENPTMYEDIELKGPLGQPMRVCSDIGIGCKADLTVDTTLYQMDWIPSRTESASPRHCYSESAN